MAVSRSRLAAGLFLTVSLPLPARSQERIYVSQLSPSRYHAFAFDGTNFVREDLDPRSTAEYLKGGLEVFSLTATDRLFVGGTGAVGLGVDVVDPSTGAELPRVRTTALVGDPIVSVDQSFAFLPGNDSAGVPGVSVVDLRPSSGTFLREIRFAPLAGDGRVDRATLSPLGDVLFVALTSNSLAPNAQIQAVSATDLPNLAAPIAPLSVTTIPAPAPPFPGLGAFRPVDRLRAFRLGGLDYLFAARRDLSVLQIVGGTSVLQGTISSSRSAPPAGLRDVRDVWAADTPLGRRAFAATDAGGSAEEVVVVDLDGTIADDPTGTRVTQAVTLTTAGSGDPELIGGSLTGSTLFVLNQGSASFPRENAELIALDRAALLAGVPVVSRVPIDPAGTFVEALGMVVRNALAPAPAPTLTSATVNGSPILVNDAPRALAITGSGLLGARHVFLGIDRLTPLVAGPPNDATLQATSPILLPAGREPLLVVTDAGGIGRFDGLVVANSPSFRPAHRLYASANTENRVALLHAASSSEVTTFFDTGAGPVAGVVSLDGGLLFVSLFREAAVEVYSTVDDPVRGWQANQRVARLHTGGFPQRMVLNSAGTRLYVTTLGGAAVIDVTADPPVLIDTDGDFATTDADVDPVLSPGLTKISFSFSGDGVAARSVALSDDGEWLYAGRNLDPHIMAAFVGDDIVAPLDRTFVSIPSPPGFGRVDGLLVRGSRLYFASAADNPGRVRLFDVAGSSIVPASASSVAMPAGSVPSVRTLSLLPDGRFLYVASRTPGPSGVTLHVMDAATNSFVAGLSPGAFTDTATPAPTNDFVYAGSAESDVVTTVDARAGSPTLHSILGATRGGKGTGGAVVDPGLETPTGVGVLVSPASGVSLTFSSVTASGNTTVTSANVSSVALPEGFAVSGIPVFYDVRTTATFTGTVQVCFTYDDTGVASEADLRLLHEEAGVFVDRTSSLDTGANQICGEVTSFSLFVVAERTGARTLCATLGRPRHNRLPDLDSFVFRGSAHEEVTLTVTEQEEPDNTGDLVGLVVLDLHHERRVLAESSGPLPQAVHLTLRRQGSFKALVVPRPGRRGFRGAYCATLQSSGDAFLTFEAR